MFEIAATRFGDPDGEYHLARMFIDGAGGLEKDKLRAAKWLGLAAEKGHHGAQALLGHMLFRGDGVPRQAARGLMWLTIANVSAKSEKDAWIHELEAKDLGAASDNERSAAAAYPRRARQARDRRGARRARARRSRPSPATDGRVRAALQRQRSIQVDRGRPADLTDRKTRYPRAATRSAA